MFPKDGRMVLVLPAWRGFQQMVRKHRVHRPTLASGRESRQAPSGACETLHPAGEYIFQWVWITFKLSENLHPAGNCPFEWVWIPFKLSGARKTLQPAGITSSNWFESRWFNFKWNVRNYPLSQRTHLSSWMKCKKKFSFVLFVN